MNSPVPTLSYLFLPKMSPIYNTFSATYPDFVNTPPV